MTATAKARILYIGMIPPEVGGQEAGGIATHAWQLAMEAHKKGYEVYMLAGTTSSFTKDGVRVIGPFQKNRLLRALHAIKFWVFNLNCFISGFLRLNFLNFKEKIKVLYGASFLQEIIESIKPDLIHVHSFLKKTPLSLSVLKNCPPIVITDHGIGVTYEYGLQDLFKIKNITYFSKIVKEIAKKANYVITVSEFEKHLLIKNFNLPDSIKIKTIVNPFVLNSKIFSKVKIKAELGFSNKKKIVFFAGASYAIKKKGLDILLKAFAGNKYLRSKCKLFVVTKGEALSFAQDFVKKNNIDGLILGPQTWEKVNKYHNAADVFVMPSRIETFSLVYIEALYVGTPIIGFHENVREIENMLSIYIGETFDAQKENEKILAEKIIKVLNTEIDEDIIRKKVIENLSWDAKFSEFNSIYNEALKR